LLREFGARHDGFTRRRGKSPLHAHLQEIEAELAAFERLQRIAGRHNWAKEGGTLKEKLRRAAVAGDHEAAAAVGQTHSPASRAECPPPLDPGGGSRHFALSHSSTQDAVGRR
jgi:hypothetical protein